jgi:hypothetical protein
VGEGGAGRARDSGARRRCFLVLLHLRRTTGGSRSRPHARSRTRRCPRAPAPLLRRR